MKKLVIGTAIALAAVASYAADVTVSAVRDYNTQANGVRVETTVPFGLTASITEIDQVAGRLALGKKFDVAKVGPVALNASVAGVYQNSHAGAQSGYGMTVGVGAAYPLTKSVALTAGVERFIGQERISQFNGNVATVGLNVKF